MSYYLKDGELLFPTVEGMYDVRSKLPVGTYTVCADPKRGWFLKPITEFNISGKIYGNATRYAERILNTFDSRPHTTGVLLNGEKGSGKTMLAKRVSQLAASRGVSTLVINTPFHGDSFNTFIQEISEPCVIVFDEFEKVYDAEKQEAILTLLDGVYPTKKLFILTVNDKYKVNSHMKNRPGRIFYMLEFKGLDADFIREYCDDNLDNKTYIDQVCRLTLLFDSFNFDMLKALVEEMNRYKESPIQAMEMLNAKPYDAGSVRHNVEVYMEGAKIPDERVHPTIIRGNPIAHDELEFYITPNAKVGEDQDDISQIEVSVTQQMLKKIDVESGKFTYVINEGQSNMAVLVITRELAAKSAAYNWLSAF